MMSREPHFTPYTGGSGSLKNSTWLAAEDIDRGPDGKDVIVTIEAVLIADQVEWDQGRKEGEVPFLKFKGKAKMLKLNSTVRKTLVGLFGTAVTEWAGQRIALYVDRNVKLMGKTVLGIRVRDKALEAKQKRAADAISEPTDQGTGELIPEQGPAEPIEDFDAPFG